MEELRLKRLAIMPTLKCTLRCKICSNYMTMFDNVEHIPVAEIKRDIERIFKIVDHTNWLQFVGGEIFMRHDMWEVYEYCRNFKTQFDKLILITNATVLPCEKDIEVFAGYGDNIQVQISDYGKYSYKSKALTELLGNNKIPYVVKKYYGDIQHYSGWIDNTNFTERGKNEDDLCKQFEDCGQVEMQNIHMYRGVMHGCARSLMASTLGRITPAKRDFIDLNDDTMSDTQKKEVIRHFNDSPRVSCKSCVSFNETSDRFPAAEQL